MSAPELREPSVQPVAADTPPLVPARMVNEYVYCPRLAYLEWVQGEWVESSDTVEGRHAHRRVNRDGGKLPPPADVEKAEKLHARSITLSSDRLGLIARMDLIESDGAKVTPVDYKRGKRPHVERGAHDPERVQLCVQGMLLREHGYDCDEGVLYFVGSRERVRVAFDDELVADTQQAVDGLRRVAAEGVIPPPLEDSPKCPRCSLVEICLPDEVHHLKGADVVPRPISVPCTDALPLYVQARRAKVAKSGETLVVTVEDAELATARLEETSQVVVMGNVYLTTPCLHELMWRGIPVTWHSYGGWFFGHTTGNGHKNVELRTAQYRASFDESTCLRFARGLVIAKIQNCRTLLRRNWKRAESSNPVLVDLKSDSRRAARADSLPELLGVEGTAAARYFRSFGAMVNESESDAELSFDFETRNRRPPKDPVNALLSFAYSLLVRSWTVTLGGSRVRRLPRPLPSAPLRPSGAGARPDGAVPPPGRRLGGRPGDQQRRGQADRLQDRRRQRESRRRRPATVHLHLRAPPRARGRPPALRLPRQLSPVDGDAGPPVRPVPPGRAARVPELHHAVIPWSTSTSSSTTSVLPSGGGGCSS